MRTHPNIYPWIYRPLVLLALISLTSCAVKRSLLHGSPYQSPNPAPDFSLPSTKGNNFKLTEQHGRIILLYFGYTFCPDICPATLAELHMMIEENRFSPEQVTVVMVTVDPDRDSLGHLQQYLARFDPSFIGLRAEGDALATLMSAYGVYAEKDPDSDPDQYLVTHTARVFLVDDEGVLRTNYAFGTPLEDIQSDIQTILGEQP